MKKILFLFILFSWFVFSQTTVKTTINYSGNTLFDGVVDGVEYSTAIPLKGKEGIVTLALDLDTTGASVKGAQQSDSCWTFGFQLYFDGIGWSTYYNDRTAHKGVDFTKIDTVDRKLQTGENLFVNIATATTADAVADSFKFVHFIGTGDSLNATLETRQE